jgi:ABC-2 type transport system ATP-binding protein
MIVIERLTKSYRHKPVLRELSMVARAGDITLLVGPNAAGKTTTVRILAGIADADSGSARIESFDVASDRVKAQARLSYIPQRVSFHPRLTCLEILRFYAHLRRIASSRCEAMLHAVGLTESSDVRTGELSGGMRQRLGIALLLLPDAPVLLLDEPGLSLDPEWRQRLQQALQFEAARGKTVVVTTHLIAEWNNVANRCLLCREGRIERELDARHLTSDFDDQLRGDEQNELRVVNR